MFSVNFAKNLKTLTAQNTSELCHRVFPKRAFLNIVKVFLNVSFLRQFFSVEIPECPVHYFRNIAERLY